MDAASMETEMQRQRRVGDLSEERKENRVKLGLWGCLGYGDGCRSQRRTGK